MPSDLKFGIAYLIWLIIVSFLLLQPDHTPTSFELFPHQDKLIHFFFFGVGSFLLFRFLHLRLKFTLAQTVISVILVMAGYGALTEYVQGFVVGRSTDLNDFLADSAGILLMTVGLFFEQKRK